MTQKKRKMQLIVAMDDVSRQITGERRQCIIENACDILSSIVPRTRHHREWMGCNGESGEPAIVGGGLLFDFDRN